MSLLLRRKGLLQDDQCDPPGGHPGVGGGPTGMGAAPRLQERAADWHLVETTDGLGGMAGTVTDDIPRGYPVPTLGRDDLLHEVDAGLIRAGVRSRGRFGGWRYESCNQDYAFQQGVEAVEAIMTGSPEDVYWHPERF